MGEMGKKKFVDRYVLTLCFLGHCRLCRCSLLLLENNCIHRDSNTSAHRSQHGEGHLKLLVLHPVQVVHVLGVDVVWLIMSVRPHPPYASRLECTRS